MKPDKPYFRVGVGALLYYASGEIICFRRADKPDLWQFPQGGVDAEESYEDTLWRELYEETALTRDSINSVRPYPDWTLYEYPPALQPETGSIVGQVHRWYFLELQTDATPDLDRAADKEFSDWKCLRVADFLALPGHDFKLPMYKKLAHYFQNSMFQK